MLTGEGKVLAMARVVAVHGINNTYSGPHQMAEAWRPAMLDGVTLAGHAGVLTADDLGCAFYGDVFRGEGRTLGADAPWYEPEDVEAGIEADLLNAWWAAAAETDPAVVPPNERTLGLGSSVQAALAALASCRFFARVSERLLILFIKQVRAYMTDPAVHAKIQDRFASAVGPDTSVVVAHSLGSVVAYEALCTNPQWNVTTFVTVGSPLGIRNVIFDRLRPAPQRLNGSATLRGAWPCRLESWTNIGDSIDIVALVKKLGPLFGSGDRIIDIEIDNGISVHEVLRYLSAPQTGAAIAAGIAHG
jgi:hypothetical protein